MRKSFKLRFATLITRNSYETIPDGIVAAASVDGCGTLMAGALMVAAPTLLVYTGLGRYFIGGLTAGSVT